MQSGIQALAQNNHITGTPKQIQYTEKLLRGNSIKARMASAMLFILVLIMCD